MSKSYSLFISFFLYGILLLSTYVLHRSKIMLWLGVFYCLCGLIIVLVGNPPNSPTNVIATGGNTTATIYFTGYGGTYTVLSNPGGISVSSNSSPITINGITNGISYTFIVSASNTFGSSDSSVSNTIIPHV